jgi:hypothetical protein
MLSPRGGSSGFGATGGSRGAVSGRSCRALDGAHRKRPQARGVTQRSELPGLILRYLIKAFLFLCIHRKCLLLFSRISARSAPPIVPISSSRMYFPKPILEALGAATLLSVSRSLVHGRNVYSSTIMTTGLIFRIKRVLMTARPETTRSFQSEVSSPPRR